MPLEAPLPPLADRVAALNARYRHHGATAVLSRALGDPEVGRLALVSSFGAESVALLHLVAVIDPSVPVIFIDTEMLFDETLAYQRKLAAVLGLRDLRIVRAGAAALRRGDPERDLHLRNPDLCCGLRKTAPLQRALQGFDGWITGRKRFQGGDRAGLEFFEEEDGRRIKVNPLARWSPGDVQDYIANNRLPRHPLVAQGYRSIGCRPCTSPVAPEEDARAGRWRGRTKTECGIHFANGRALRAPQSEGENS